MIARVSLVVLLLGALACAQGPIVKVDLAPYFNADGIALDSDRSDGQLDESGSNLAGEQMPPRGSTFDFGPVAFRFPDYAAGARNNVEADGQVIAVPPGRYAALFLLATATDGPAEGELGLSYASGPPVSMPFVLPDWCSGGAGGVLEAVRFTFRHNGVTGLREQMRGALWVVAFGLDANRTLTAITLPRNRRVHVFALTLGTDRPDLSAAAALARPAPADPDLAKPEPPRLFPYAKPRERRTSFQTNMKYIEDIDLRTDVVMVYASYPDRIRSWADKGYSLETMLSISHDWGGPYVTGRSDGEEHYDKVQAGPDGRYATIGGSSYYMCPDEEWTAYLIDQARAAIDAGSGCIVLEEPEYWAWTGYSPSLRREWESFYGVAWADPQASPRAQWLASQLRARLYERCAGDVFEFIRGYSPGTRRMLATHSNLNYSAWGIIFPHSALARMPACDGVINQVWTGTARTPVKLGGRMAQRVFENAYLEFASLATLGDVSDLALWHLADPVEDNNAYTWAEYRRWWRETVAASLLFPGVGRYEVMPWPDRVFAPRAVDATGAPPPAEYLTELLVAFDAQRRQPPGEPGEGAHDLAVLSSDTMMWQRGGPWPSNMDGFYGLALPALVRGAAVSVPLLELAPGRPEYLGRYRVLAVSFDAMKPISSAHISALARYVQGGGCLVVLGGADDYNDIDAWWNREGYARPQDALFDMLGLALRPYPPSSGAEPAWTQVLSAHELSGAHPRTLENLDDYTVDLAPFLPAESVAVKFEDGTRSDGWGPWLSRVRFECDAGADVPEFSPGGRVEARYLAEVVGRGDVDEARRFADGNGRWVYLFPTEGATRGSVTLTMGNDFVVSVSAGYGGGTRRLVAPPGARSGAVSAFEAAWDGEGRARSPFDWNLPASGLTTYAPADPRISVLGVMEDDPDAAAFFYAEVGRGHVVLLGVPAAQMATARGEGIMWGLWRGAYETAVRGALPAPGGLRVRRGDYEVASALTSQLALSGPFVDLFDAGLPVLKGMVLGPGEQAFVRCVDGPPPGRPQVIAVAGKVETDLWKSPDWRLVVAGPTGTRCAMRVRCAGRPSVVSAADADGGAVEVLESWDESTSTLLLGFPNCARGVELRLRL